MPTRIVDSKGRVTIGSEFAESAVSVEYDEANGRIVLIPLRMIPERETWLYANDTALTMVRRGLAAARAGELESIGDIDDAFAFADSIDN